MADLAVVVAITNTDAKTPAHGISLFLVDADTPGFKKGRKLKKVGFKAQVNIKNFSCNKDVHLSIYSEGTSFTHTLFRFF